MAIEQAEEMTAAIYEQVPRRSIVRAVRHRARCTFAEYRPLPILQKPSRELWGNHCGTCHGYGQDGDHALSVECRTALSQLY